MSRRFGDDAHDENFDEDGASGGRNNRRVNDPFMVNATEFNEFEERLRQLRDDEEHNPQLEARSSFGAPPPPPPPRPTTSQQLRAPGAERSENNQRNDPQPVDLSNVLATMNTLILQNTQLMNQLCFQRGRTRDEESYTRNFHVMPDITKSIKNFDGEDPNEGRPWLDSLMTTARLHSWPEQVAFETARMHLHGSALSWYRSRADSIVDWLTFRRAFLKTYGHGQNLTASWDMMRRRKQTNTESIHAYFHDKVRLCNQLQLSFLETKEQVIVGLLSDDLAKVATARSHIDEDDLYEDLVRQQRLLHERRSERSGGPHRARNLNIGPVTATEVKTPSRSTSENTTNKSQYNALNVVRCYNCNKFGHIAKNCTVPVRERGSCFVCCSTSHKAQNCPEKKSARDASSNVTNRDTNNTTNVIHGTTQIIPPFTVILKYLAKLDDKNTVSYSLNALIDSGSPISLIKNSFVSKNSVAPYEKQNNTFVGINGSPLDILGTFKTDCTVDNIQIVLTFYVVNDETMSYPVLLGRDYISLPNVDVQFVKSSQIDCDDKVDDEFNEILRVDVGSLSHFSDKLIMNPDLDTETKSKMIEVFEETYFASDVTSTPLDFSMKICLTSDQPITFRPRKLSYADKQKLQTILDKYLEEDIIELSDSPYGSPIVLVPKKNGETRLCVDYRAINKITVKDNFPTPLIDDLLDRLRNKHYFTSLDLKNGFHHIPVDADSRKYTSFVTPLGQFQFKKVPFGLTNSPRVFQRFTSLIFGKLIRENKVLLYLDDVLIATESLGEHLEILREVLLVCKGHGLELRFDKCMFLFNTITYLGYCIDRTGIRPSKENVKSVLEYPVPRSPKDLQRFLGLASYFRRFIEHFSTIAKPLYDLMKKDAEFKMGEQQLAALEKIKTKLTTAPVLAIYSPTSETHVYCDASASGFGAIITQRQDDGKFKPIFYFSRRTTPTESKYHSFELECLAVVYTLQRFHVYLAGLQFKIFTDCDSFRLTLSKQNINPRISRWAMFLQNYTFEIEHRPNSKMTHVDALSRCHSVLILQSNTFEQTLALKQSQDPKIREITNELGNSESKNFELRDGLLYRKWRDDKLLFYVPESMETSVIRTCHDDMGHVGLTKVIERIQQIYWFPKMTQKVRDHIDNCLKCIEFSPKSGRQEGFLHCIPKGDTPFVWLHIDHYGPLEKGERGYKFIQTVVDGFSKFVRFYPCKSTGAAEAIANLKKYYRSYSRPKRIVSDRGSAFNCEAFREYCEQESINFTLIATGTPRANGQAERFHRQLTPILAKSVNSPNQWVKVLPDVEFAINNTVSRSTGFTPSQLLFGRNQNGPANDNIREILENLVDNERDLDEIRLKASKHIECGQKASEIAYNKRHKEPRQYSVDDYVVIRNHDVTVGVNKKLIPKFKGPYVVKKVFDNDRYLVTDVDGFQLTQRPFKTVCGPDQMKPWSST